MICRVRRHGLEGLNTIDQGRKEKTKSCRCAHRKSRFRGHLHSLVVFVAYFWCVVSLKQHNRITIWLSEGLKHLRLSGNAAAHVQLFANFLLFVRDEQKRKWKTTLKRLSFVLCGCV